MINVVLEKIEESRARLSSTESFRVFHGRGGCYPDMQWLCVDYFQPVLLFTFFQEPPDNFVSELADRFSTIAHTTTVSALLCQKRYAKEKGGCNKLELLAGEWSGELRARRGKLQFELSTNQQNIGYFLDIEPLRCWLEKHAHRTRVLNLFAFTCAFSVVASACDAQSVVNIDLNKNALNRGRDNHRLNELPGATSVTYLAHDILRSWGKLKRLGPYDIVIVDPPSFQKGSFVATKDYQKVLRKLPDLMSDNGYAVLCLNAPEISMQAFRRLVDAEVLPLLFCEALPVSEDFPDVREPALKMLIYRFVRNWRQG